MADGIVAVEKCAREPLAHLYRTGYQDGNHPLEAHFLEFFHVVFIAEADNDGRQILDMLCDFRAEVCFASDQTWCRGDGKLVTVIVLSIPKTGNKVAYVA